MMTLDFANAVLAMAPAGNGQNQTPMMVQMFPLLLLLVAFYFALWRPQKQRAKKHAELMKSIKSGDKIATSSGIIGIVVGVKDRSVSIRSADSKLEILKSAVSDILERDNDPAKSDS